jgi:quinol monooxygenase YgiN
MYIRLVRFTLGPGKLDAAKKLSSDLVPAISSQTGCKSVTTFGDPSTGDYGLTVLWNSKEEADAAAQVIGPKLMRHLTENNAAETADIHLYEVIGNAP